MFGYDKVHQTFVGYDSNGNDYWKLDCSDPGLTRCRMHYMNFVTGSSAHDDLVAESEGVHFNLALEWVDNLLLKSRLNNYIRFQALA